MRSILNRPSSSSVFTQHNKRQSTDNSISRRTSAHNGSDSRHLILDNRSAGQTSQNDTTQISKVSLPGDLNRHHSIGDLHPAKKAGSIPRLSIHSLPSLRPSSTTQPTGPSGRRIAVNPSLQTPDSSRSYNHDIPPRPNFRRQKPLLPFLILFPLHYLVHLATLLPYYRLRRAKGSFIDNTVRTSRYTLISFIPCQLLAQFSKIANLYFLIVSALQLLPGVSPTGKYTTVAPLAVFVGLAMAREAWDDWQRSKQDTADNNLVARRLRSRNGGDSLNRLISENHTTNTTETSKSGSHTISIAMPMISTGDRPSSDDNGAWEEAKWKDLRVGDIICVRDREVLPADVVVLAASTPEGHCYIETASLDGETALKQKQALDLTNGKLRSVGDLASWQGTITAETPTDNLYRFEAYIQPGSAPENTRHPLTIGNFLPRGSILRNTGHIYGVIIYTGEDTKIRRNASAIVVSKTPELETRTNWIVGLVFILLLILTTGATLAYRSANKVFMNENTVWYLWDEVPDNTLAWWGVMNPSLSGGPTPSHHNNATTKPDYPLNDPAHNLIPTWRQFCTFFVLLNTLIPISLYVTMEIIKLVQAHFINQDLDMYDPVTDTPAQARTSNLNEDLGQVQYVFTDKTGTLTENLMVFKRLSVGGRWYLHAPGGMGANPDGDEGEARGVKTTCQLIGKITEANKIEDANSGEIREESGAQIPIDILQRAVDLIEAMALCHSAVPETITPGKTEKCPPSIVYTASSPDETALVTAADQMQFSVRGRTINSISLNILGGAQNTTYTILQTLEFSSARKRMSVIVRYPHQENRILVICKGADSVILDRLCDPLELFEEERDILDKTLEHVAEFAGQGLRTLLYACRVVDEAEYEVWSRDYAEASAALDQREEMMENVASRIEQGMILMGATAIEDKLQPSVGVTIEKLARAGIKVWMLTGDKRETAVNIGYTCRLAKPWSVVIQIGGESVEDIRRSIQMGLERCWSLKGGKKRRGSKGGALMETRQPSFPGTPSADRNQPPHVVVVITGDTLMKLEAQHTNVSEPLCPVQSYFAAKTWKKRDPSASSTTTTTMLKDPTPHETPEHSLLNSFLDLGILSDAAICCRFSPSQKALIVSSMRERIKYRHKTPYRPVSTISDPPPPLLQRLKSLYKRNPTPSNVTLAIGDGANDIPMLQSAHVGIGITGREGLAASRASDYSFAQFRFLQPLLLIHGRYSYIRISFFIGGTFYKCFTLYLTQLIYQRWCGFTGQSLYEQWTLALFNIAFSLFPVMIGGILQRDLTKATLLEVPELYGYGQYNTGLNAWKMAGWIFAAARHAAISSLLTFFMYQGFTPFGRSLMLQAGRWFGYNQNVLGADAGGPWQEQTLIPLGITVYTVALFIITCKVAYVGQANITYIHHIGAVGSIVLWFIWSQVYFNLYPKMGSFGEEVAGVLNALRPTLGIRILLLWVLSALALCCMDFMWTAWTCLFRGVEVGSEIFVTTEGEVRDMLKVKKERKRRFGWVVRKKDKKGKEVEGKTEGEGTKEGGPTILATAPIGSPTGGRKKQLNDFNMARKKAAAAAIQWRHLVEEQTHNKPREQIDWDASVRWWRRWEAENGVQDPFDPFARPESCLARTKSTATDTGIEACDGGGVGSLQRGGESGAFESLGRADEQIGMVRPGVAASTLRKHTLYRRKTSVPNMEVVEDGEVVPPVPSLVRGKVPDVATIV
ncbi:hypothetical protein HK097_001086 [Rhizophlyctis rosea]|uniref:Phospholipid-transporting ATPase n=1 Tax=Rhizophlyctis rosea TaxID=64517 RepID=A0AAD5S760_9FUNG|nr:hypothetical protein HK097_001086 [Rhizophlyctis rosea]